MLVGDRDLGSQDLDHIYLTLNLFIVHVRLIIHLIKFNRSIFFPITRN
jgi:hypothetical protein